MSRDVQRYSPDNPVMTGETLLDLAQSHKLASLKRSFSYDIGVHDKIKVTEEDIEIMGDTLKSIVFYIPTNAYREAMELARERGVLIETSRWLKS
jgi:hypothetical protein